MFRVVSLSVYRPLVEMSNSVYRVGMARTTRFKRMTAASTTTPSALA